MTRFEEVVANSPTRPLLCAVCYTYNPVFVEMTGSLGFSVIWIEMEHGHITFNETADLCRLTQALGLLAMIRIPDSRRENILKAAECDPDIIDLPMTNSLEIAAEFVKHARYHPEGQRGFYGSARAQKYGLPPNVREEHERVNRELSLMAQIETIEAVELADDICSLPGINAILLGPGDLSTSLGIPGQTAHPEVREAAGKAIAAAKSHGRLVAVAAPAKDTSFWTEKGVDMICVATDVTCMRLGLQSVVAQARGGT